VKEEGRVLVFGVGVKGDRKGLGLEFFDKIERA